MPSKLFGGSKQKTTNNGVVQTNRIRTKAGNSSLDSINKGGFIDNTIKLDPVIEQIRNSSLSGFNSLLSSVNSDIDSLRSSANDFIQARVNPLRENIGLARGSLERGLNRRGVFGSLSNNELSRFDNNANRQIADQTALATADANNQIFQRQQFGSNLNSAINAIAQQILNQELSKLGLGNVPAGTIAQSSLAPTSTTTSGSSNSGILGTIGTGLRFASAIKTGGLTV